MDSLIKNLDKDDFKYLSGEFNSNKLDKATQKDLMLMTTWMVLKSSKNNCQAKKGIWLYSSLTVKKN